MRRPVRLIFWVPSIWERRIISLWRQRLKIVRKILILGGRSKHTGCGAGHLVGEDGIIELLRKRGYTVRRL
ncbi:MAG: hypothetical protein GX085_05115 [Firmicutes bacterium]|nr:hypothetical protein [Bacillota bacterium]